MPPATKGSTTKTVFIVGVVIFLVAVGIVVALLLTKVIKIPGHTTTAASAPPSNDSSPPGAITTSSSLGSTVLSAGSVVSLSPGSHASLSAGPIASISTSPQDCTYDDWKDTSCASLGLMTQTRAVKTPAANGGTCSGPTTRQIADAVACPAPTNCVWSDWQDTGCVVPGLMYQTRTVRTPAANGGTCNGPSNQQVANTTACPIPIDCSWSEWNNTGCTAPGQMRQMRTVSTPATNGGKCNGPSTQIVTDWSACPAPVACQWGLWTNTGCAGYGLLNQTRAVATPSANGGAACMGPQAQQVPDKASCPTFSMRGINRTCLTNSLKTAPCNPNDPSQTFRLNTNGRFTNAAGQCLSSSKSSMLWDTCDPTTSSQAWSIDDSGWISRVASNGKFCMVNLPGNTSVSNMLCSSVANSGAGASWELI